MTICCAYTDGKTTWIASDRQVSVGGSKKRLAGGKWVELPSGWWVGLSGFTRGSLLLEAASEQTYDAGGLVQRIRSLILADAWVPYDPEPGPAMHRMAALLARPGELWEMTADFGAMRVCPWELAAIGSGQDLARGAAFALGQKASGLDIVSVSIRAAVYGDTGCGFEPWAMALER